MPQVLNKYRSGIPSGSIYVGRGSKWGNPFRIDSGMDRDAVIRLFCEAVLPSLDVTELRGKDLVCFCAPLPCHADWLLIKANNDESEIMK